MQQGATITFSKPVSTDGLPGFPASLGDVARARAVVQAERLPIARSRHAWVEASNRLAVALASRSPAHTEAARIALTFAVAGDLRDGRRALAAAA